MKRLERENKRLHAENAFLKKLEESKGGVVNKLRLHNKYSAIQDLHDEENLPIILLCEISGVSRAAYYKWLKRTPTARELENEAIVQDIRRFMHK